MNNSQYKILKGLERFWVTRVDRGHLFLAAALLATVSYYSYTLDSVSTTTTEQIIALEENLLLADSKVKVLEEEYFYGPPKQKDLSYEEIEVHVAYVEKKEALVRDQVIPILTAQIEALRPKSEKARELWLARGLPDSEEMANVYYDAARKFDHDPTVLIAIGWKESRYRADVCSGFKMKKGKTVKVRSSAGAMGCMQIMPQWIDEFDNLESEEDLLDFKNNVMAGAAIFRQYMDHRYGKGRFIPALYMYNYGPRRYGYKVRNKTKFNDYAVAVMKKVKRLKKIIPIDFTLTKSVKAETLNPL